MKNTLLLLASLFPLAVGVQLAPGPSEPVIVERYRSSPMTVDLLSVRDSAIVVSLVPGLSDDSLSHCLRAICVIPFSEISRVYLEGSNSARSYALKGGGIGALFGAGMGAATAREDQGRDARVGFALVGAFVGGVAGCGVGCVVGLGVRDDADVVTPRLQGVASLRKLARYPVEEPRWLREKGR